ncbi:MAG TPA: type II toxin-antitoxin system PemK/MazF family toxin [Thermoanaerobaculia bacterium]|nr:type II toxin-antitoxin system PemK/MazF family toxin [Thermoanaerobaculia bacterium]
MKRGDVWWAELRPRSGSEQRGRRPVIVVSHDAFNESPGWQSVIVVPLSTSGAQGRRGPTAIPVPARGTGLERDSIALCHQVTTLDRSKLSQRVGALPVDVVAALDVGLSAALSL